MIQRYPIPTVRHIPMTTINARHTYSLLGVTGTWEPTWTSKFIVLRNPYGKSKGDPVMPAGISIHGSGVVLILADIDGIFALQIDQFVKYFEGYAWVV